MIQTNASSPDKWANGHGFKCWHGTGRQMTGAHAHLEIEANFLCSGSMRYLFGGETVEVEAGEWIVFWGSVPHQLVFIEDETQICWLTLPLARVLGWDLPSGLIEALLNGAVVKEQADAVRDATRFADWEHDLGSEEPARVHIAELEIEARLRRLALNMDGNQPRSAHATPSDLGRVERMAAWMSQHYASPITTADIARAADIHPNYAMNLFKREFGLSLGEFLTQTRLSHAQRVLATTDKNVLDIAFACGFGSASRFHAAFKASCGCSPAGYRKRLSGV